MSDSGKHSTRSGSIETARRAWRSELGAARRRLGLRRIVQGFAAALSVCGVGLIGALIWTDHQRFDPLAVQGAQELLAACVVLAIAMLLVAAFWKASKKQLVRRIEAPSASLDGLLVSALELDASGRDAGIGKPSPTRRRGCMHGLPRRLLRVQSGSVTNVAPQFDSPGSRWFRLWLPRPR